jgi:hypothetical protein
MIWFDLHERDIAGTRARSLQMAFACVHAMPMALRKDRARHLRPRPPAV